MSLVFSVSPLHTGLSKAFLISVIEASLSLIHSFHNGPCECGGKFWGKEAFYNFSTISQSLSMPVSRL